MNLTYCGRSFSPPELERIRACTVVEPTRQAVARAVCTAFDWRKPDGGLKTMSCKVALLRMHRDGHITLPPPRSAPRQIRPTQPCDLQPQPLAGSRRALGEITLRAIRHTADSHLWNGLIAAHHYLGYYPLPGAQIRYLIYAQGQLLGALGFGAAAWKVAPRDQYIGWSMPQRQSRLHLIVNNSRFLLLPWIRVRFLASTVLALAARQLPHDWHARYGYRPLLLETFVERPRFAGTSYRAANWICLGQTQGRSKLDRHHLRDKPLKDIYVLPLDRRFRQNLTAP